MIKVVSHIVVVTWVLWTILCPPAVALPKDAAYHLEDYAAPWAAPAHIKFAYQGLHNDLRALLAQQAMRQSISVTFFTAAQRPMLLNCLYSLVNYGRALNYIVVTIDHTSLNECLRLRLPCYNATHMLGDLASEKDSSFGSPQYRKLVHSKPGIVWEVLHLGLNVHFTDVDVSFLRRVWPSYNRLLQKTGADMVFMNEFTHLNTGNFVIRYNERTVSAVRAWATAAPEREMHLTDQEWLISLRGKHYELCQDKVACRKVQDRGIAAVVLHPSQFGKVSWTGHCPGRRPWQACDPSMLYLHVICYSGKEHKMYWMKHYDLWHLQADDITPVGNASQHKFLPCADQVAWRGGPAATRSGEDLHYPKTIFDDSDDDDVKNLPRPSR